MSNTQKAGADYSVVPSELHEAISLLVQSRQPCMVWGPPGVGKSEVAQQVAKDLGYEYIDVRCNLLDPVDLRGIPWRDGERTRWAPPAFLPDENAEGNFLINLEELSSALPAVQAALYQLLRDRAIGEAKLPEGAAVIACGNREGDRGVAYRMPTPAASRLIHVTLRPDVKEWCAWALSNGLPAELAFFIQFRPDLLHVFDPHSAENAFPCPRTWEFVGGLLSNGSSLSQPMLRSLVVGAIGEAAAIEFMAFLRIWKELPHPSAILGDPKGCDLPENSGVLLALCGSLCHLADDTNFDGIADFAGRDDMRAEVGEFLISSCVHKNPELQQTRAFIQWVASSTA